MPIPRVFKIGREESPDVTVPSSGMVAGFEDSLLPG